CSQVIPRLANGQFRPGTSGNPGGRPAALAEVKQLARQHTALAIQKLAHIAEHGQLRWRRLLRPTRCWIEDAMEGSMRFGSLFGVALVRACLAIPNRSARSRPCF